MRQKFIVRLSQNDETSPPVHQTIKLQHLTPKLFRMHPVQAPATNLNPVAATCSLAAAERLRRPSAGAFTSGGRLSRRPPPAVTGRPALLQAPARRNCRQQAMG